MISFLSQAFVKALDSVTSAQSGDTVSTACKLHSFQLSTGAGTISYEASLDGNVWHVLGTSNTPGEIKTFEGCFSYVRARVSTYTSGSIVVLYKGIK
jgi:hypothetical protein